MPAISNFTTRQCNDAAPILPAIDRFINELRAGASVEQALLTAEIPDAVRDFVLHTFDVIKSGDLCAVASSFAFGREDLLPDVFRQIVAKLNIDAAGDLSFFKYYFERHIDLDGEQHGPMAEALIESLCGDRQTNWRVVEDAAVSALDARLRLWDGLRSTVEKHSNP